MRRIVWVAAVCAAAAATSPAQGQVCNGMRFKGSGMVAARYVSGDAADHPYTVQEIGGVAVRQLPGWNPMGAHHAVSFSGAAGHDTWTPPLEVGGPRLLGSGARGGASYTADILPGSYGGAYTICVNAAVNGQWSRVGGFTSRGVTVPAWVSFGVPLGFSAIGVLPHAGMGAYFRDIVGSSPAGSDRARGFRPLGYAGLGMYAGPIRADATVEHELKSADRVLLTIGIEP